jgi:hypothetical protein
MFPVVYKSIYLAQFIPVMYYTNDLCFTVMVIPKLFVLEYIMFFKMSHEVGADIYSSNLEAYMYVILA